MRAESIRKWGKTVYDSPLYSALVDVIAESQSLLEVLDEIEHTPRPNVLLGAVQFLLMEHPDDPLTRFYPNLGGSPSSTEGLASEFHRFVGDHREEILRIGRTRYTQTNEVRRCAVLLPAIWSGPLREFHLIDVGTSAGLNLAIDRYRYRWGDVEWGDSELLLECEPRGEDPKPTACRVLSRTGLDLHPVDLTSESDRRWLDALIWPGHEVRRTRLRKAMDLATGLELELVPGDALTTLPNVLSELPPGEPAVVMHSFVLNQLSPEERERFASLVEAARQERPVVRVGLEWLRLSADSSEIHYDDGGGMTVLGTAHHHGEWIDLYARP